MKTDSEKLHFRCVTERSWRWEHHLCEWNQSRSALFGCEKDKGRCSGGRRSGEAEQTRLTMDPPSSLVSSPMHVSRSTHACSCVEAPPGGKCPNCSLVFKLVLVSGCAALPCFMRRKLGLLLISCG